MKADVLTLQAGEKAGTIELHDAIYGLEPRRDILHRMVTYQLAKRQAGTHKTKERGEITGTSKKYGNQKGSGGARHGNRKAPIFVGGGVAHGPRVRSHATKLNKKIRSLALRHALSAKVAKSELIVIEDTKFDEAKTRALAGAFTKLGLSNVLVVDRQFDENFVRAAKNIPNVDVLPVIGANVYDILKHEKLVLTRAAVEGLEARLS